jgi:uncharacterized membrane protein YfcA
MINPSFAAAQTVPTARFFDGAAWQGVEWRRTAMLLVFAFGSIAAPVLARNHGHSLAPFVTVAAIFAGSLVSGIAGFAFSAVAGALLLHFVPPTQVVSLLLACSITTQLFSITSLWKTMQWRLCAPFLVGGFVGIPFGAMLLRGVDPRFFAGGFGAFLVAYGAYMLLKPDLVIRNKSRVLDALAGFGGGVTGGALAFPGAAPTIWCSLRGLPKQVQRGVVQPFILVMQIATLAYFSRLGLLTTGTGITYLLCVPAVIAGTWLGVHLYKRIDDAMFRRFVLAFLLLSGGVLAAGSVLH